MAAPMDWRGCLNEISLFEKLRKNEVGRRKHDDSTNILTVQNGEIFVWNRQHANVLTSNLKILTVPTESADKKLQLQTFLCTDPPVFEVDNLQLSCTGQYLALIGRRGISVLLIPRKWGKFAAYEGGGKQRITCRTFCIDEHLFASDGKVSVLQASWHPGSNTDSHLVVLTTDNMLRVYNITEPYKPLLAIRLGYQDALSSLSFTKLSIGAALGGSAVSFDFGQPTEQPVTSNSGDDQAQTWPVFVLQGNGDVCMVDLNFNSTSFRKPEVQGPLSMFPPADDNYGTDACSILCLPTQPPVVIIAECTGKLYHCVVLKSADDEGETKSEVSWSSSTSQFGRNADISLYVFEKVELELSLTKPPIDPQNLEEDDFSCPIRLHTDSVCKERYHCSHTAGVHTVALPWIQKMEQFCDDENSDMYLNAVQGVEAIVEHVICTKPLATSQDSPIAGLCVVSDHLLGNTLLCLTSEFECIALPLVSTFRPPTPPLLSTSSSKGAVSPLRKFHKEPFQERIRKILQRNTSNPILRSKGDSGMNQQQCFQLLTRATQVFREEYIQKQDLAREEIERRVLILTDVKEQQQSELRDCQAAKNQLTERAENLAVRHEDCLDAQEGLQERLHLVLSRLQRHMPVLSHAERNMQKELNVVEDKLNIFKKAIEQIQVKQDYQKKQITQQSKKHGGGGAMSSGQTKRLRDVIKEESDQIGELVQQVKSLSVQVEDKTCV